MRFELDEQQRDFAASVDAALASADVPAAVRAWTAGDTAPGRKVWARLADLGVTALAVPERFGGIGAHPVDLVVALERIGHWCVPGPGHRIHRRGTGFDGRRRPRRGAGVGRSDRDGRTAARGAARRRRRGCGSDVTGGRRRGERRDRAASSHPSVDRAGGCYDVTACGDGRPADVDRAYEVGALATAAQLVGAGQALLAASVDYAKQRTQFGRVIGSYQAIKHKLADVHIALELARPLLYGAALSLAADSSDTARDVSAAKVAAAEAAQTGGPQCAADPRRDRVHRRARPVTVAAAGAGVAFGVGRPGVRIDAGYWRHCDKRYEQERELLRETVRGLVAKHAGPEAVREAMESERGYDESLWKLLCEQVGAAALVVPEELGGAGGELADAATVLSELGRALVPTPLLGTTLAELALLAADDVDADTIGRLADGTAIGAVVLDPDYVVNGDIADVVVAVDDGRLSRWTTFTAQRVTTMDPTRRLSRVTPQATAPLGTDPGIVDTSSILLAAEQVGAAERCLELTVEYTKQRVQFGRPIGSFQALKHRMADLYVAVSAARAVVDEAVSSASPNRLPRRPRWPGSPRPKRSTRWPPKPFRCTAGSPSPGSTTSSCTSSGRTAARSCWARRGRPSRRLEREVLNNQA